MKPKKHADCAAVDTERLLADLQSPDEAARARARHVSQDAGGMRSGGPPTHPRETTDEMRRTRPD